MTNSANSDDQMISNHRKENEESKHAQPKQQQKIWYQPKIQKSWNNQEHNPMIL